MNMPFVVIFMGYYGIKEFGVPITLIGILLLLSIDLVLKFLLCLILEMVCWVRRDMREGIVRENAK